MFFFSQLKKVWKNVKISLRTKIRILEAKVVKYKSEEKKEVQKKRRFRKKGGSEKRRFSKEVQKARLRKKEVQ